MTTWINKVDARAEGAEPSITEEHIIFREGGRTRVELAEVPLEGSVSVQRTPTMESFAEVDTAPGPGQFRVHYARDLLPGTIDFNVFDRSKPVSVTYKGRGSPIRAADINSLQTGKVDDAFGAIADAAGAVQLQASGAGTLRLKSGDGIALRFDRSSNTIFIESVPVGWLPTAVPGCVVWLDAEHVDTDSGVQRWEDRSGAGNHFVLQGGTGGQPHAGVLNDHDAVMLNAYHSYRNDTLSLASAFTVFAVVSRSDPSGGSSSTLQQRLLTSDQRFSIGAYATEVATQFGDGTAWTAGAGFGPDAVLPAGSFRIVSLVRSGSGETGFVQGQSVGSLFSGVTALPTGMVLGDLPSVGGDGWEGSLAALLVYNRALGTSERRAVEQYLARKYALPIEHTIFSEMGAPAAWFDAGTLGLQDGDAVQSWTDRSPAARSLSQTDAARRPVFRAGVAGGKPVVRFDGSDLLSLASDLTARHVFVVMGNCPVPGGMAPGFLSVPRPVFANLGGGEVFSVFNFQDDAGNDTQTFAYMTGLDSAHEVSLVGGAQVPTSGFAVAHAFTSGTQVGVAVNGVSDALAAYPSTFRFGRVGGRPGSGGPGTVDGGGSFDVVDGDPGAYLQADVAEILVFDRALSTAERKQVEKYLADKYAIRVHHDAIAELPGAMLWLAAESLRDGRVSSWTDQSQRGNHLVQPVLARQPWGGSSGVIFEEGPGMYLSAQLKQMQAPVVFFVVCEFGHMYQPAANHDCVLALADSGELMAGSHATLSRHANDGTNRNRYFSFDGTAKRFGPELTPGTGEREVFTVIHSAGMPHHRLRVNGVERSVQDYPEMHYNAGEIILGCDPAKTDWFNGTVHSVLLYNRALSAAEIQTVEQYLINHYTGQ